ncbi:MAG: hypothetical protein ACI4TK_17875 [Agathobacter sp.]
MTNISIEKSFLKDLVWTSIRYCVGRKSYVVALADEIGINCYSKFVKEELRFFATDIRRQLADKLRFLPFSLRIDRISSEDRYDPIGVLMEFIGTEQIKSIKDLGNYCEVVYDANKGVYKTRAAAPNPTDYIYSTDIEDLLCWDRLANLFDRDIHRLLTLNDGTKVIAFPYWTRDMEQVGDNLYRNKDFGWHVEWKPLKEFLDGKKNLTIPYSVIKNIEEL